MKHHHRVLVPFAGALLLASLASAQHEGHQMPLTTQSNLDVGPCVQSARGLTAAIEQANAQVEDARQTNDAAKMRAAVGDLQLLLTQMKGQLADCAALGAQAQSAMANMPGMDHSKVTAASAPAPAALPPAAAGSGQVSMTLSSQPAPARTGESQFEVIVTGADGKRVSDVDVTVDFVMPAMPAMKMPEMRNRVQLTRAGNGVYRGAGVIGMAGQWDVSITAARNGQTLGVTKTKLTAQ